MQGAGAAALADAGDALAAVDFVDRVTITVHESAAPLEAEWRALAERAPVSVYQSFDWIQSWIETAVRAQGIRPAIVALRLGGRLAVILPLGVERVGPLRVARLLGGEHANVRMPLVKPGIDTALDDDAIDRLIGRIAQALRPSAGAIDLFDFDALPAEAGGRPTFLATHSTARTARCQVATIHLMPDFAALLAAHRGAKKTKKHRWQKNALAAVGGYQFRRAESEAEALALFDAFLCEKAIWFRKMGIADSFAAPGIKAFFRTLIERRWRTGEPVIDIDAIEFDGSVHAILGSGLANGRQSGYFLSIADDEWRRISPGELLIHDVVAAACARGTAVLDLGRGDERYKASWLDRPERHVRLILPVTPLGRLGLASLRVANGLERRVRSHPQLWRLVGAIRRRRGEAVEPQEERG